MDQLNVKEELKLKVRVDDHTKIKKKLLSFAVFVEKQDYTDYFFDTQTAKEPIEVRLRNLDSEKIATLKVMLNDDSLIQENREYTFDVDKPDNFVSFLEVLGFSPLCMARKKAEIYEFEDIKITLVEIVGQGYFIEITAHCKEQYKNQYREKLLGIFKRLELPKSSIDSRYYCRILKS